MDPQIFSHPGFLAGAAGSLIGLAGGAIGFVGSWQAARSREEKRGMIIRMMAFIPTVLVLVGVHCFIQIGMPDGTAKAVDEVVYPVLLIGLLLLYNRWERRCTMSADKTGQGAG